MRYTECCTSKENIESPPTILDFPNMYEMSTSNLNHKRMSNNVVYDYQLNMAGTEISITSKVNIN